MDEEDYGNNLECTYTIDVPKGHTVQIKFLDFDVEDSDVCYLHDSVTVRERKFPLIIYWNEYWNLFWLHFSMRSL